MAQFPLSVELIIRVRHACLMGRVSLVMNTKLGLNTWERNRREMTFYYAIYRPFECATHSIYNNIFVANSRLKLH